MCAKRIENDRREVPAPLFNTQLSRVIALKVTPMKLINMFVVVGLTVFAGRAFAVPFTTIIDNGPSSNRVDIVFLGDGYTTADIAAGDLTPFLVPA